MNLARCGFDDCEQQLKAHMVDVLAVAADADYSSRKVVMAFKVTAGANNTRWLRIWIRQMMLFKAADD